MKTPALYILRHAKSDWNVASGHDRDRPLNPRGQRAAQLMGRFLAANDQTPDLILTSPALRASTTADLAVEAGAFQCEVRHDEALYGADVATVLDVLRRDGTGSRRLLLINHEPTCSELIAALTGARVEFPTAALARIDLHHAWARVDAGTLRYLVLPRILEPGAR